ncbi:hypothetical protein FOHLNKBM_0158 [Methylobacterium longum]|nr:hypothetical protein FOHLNKBM_0158 [Methylobacterium longum]
MHRDGGSFRDLDKAPIGKSTDRDGDGVIDQDPVEPEQICVRAQRYGSANDVGASATVPISARTYP